MSIIINILNYVSKIIAGYCAFTIIGVIIEEIKIHRFQGKKTLLYILLNIKENSPSAKIIKYLLFICLISTLLLSKTGCVIFNIDTIHTKTDGVYSYIVQLNDSLYPAQVRLTSKVEREDDNATYSKKYLYLEKVYISDEECIEFSDTIISDNEETYVSSINGNTYRILFIDKHIDYEQIIETKTLTVINVIIDVITFLPILVNFIAIVCNGIVDKKLDKLTS